MEIDLWQVRGVPVSQETVLDAALATVASYSLITVSEAIRGTDRVPKTGRVYEF